MSKEFLHKLSSIVWLPHSKYPVLKTSIEIFISVIILTLTSPLIVLSLSYVLVMRLVLKIVFALFTENKYYLMAPEDSLWAYDTPASYTTIHSLQIFEGVCDIKKIRNKFIVFVKTKTSDGKVCTKFRHRITNIFGFYCWQNCSKSFDIKRTVRFASGDENSRFSETEVFEIMGKLSDGPINTVDLPQWEVLAFPNYIYNDGKKQVKRHYAFLIRMHHSYLDGIALTERVKYILGEDVVESAINPFKPVHVPILKAVFAHTKLLFLEPYSFLRTFTINDKSFLNRGKLCGHKVVGWTNPVKFDALKKIKSVQKTSIISILNCALTGTLRKLALRKQEQVPASIHGALTVAKFPYEWMKPQNRFSLVLFPINMSFDKVNDCLKDCHVAAKNLEISPDFLMNYYMMRTLGLFPSAVLKFIHDNAKGTVFMSNVPGSDSPLKMFSGDQMVDIAAWAPLKSTTGIGVTIYSYNGFIRANVSFDSCILSDRKDMDFVVEYFIGEIIEMGKLAGIHEEDII